MNFRTLLVLLASAMCASALPALGQEPMTLRYRVEAGQRRVYERKVRTEMTVRVGDVSRKTVAEVPVRREELVVETKADPASVRVIGLDSPQGERLVLLEENGQDRLSSVPEASRVRMLPPLLSSQWRDLRGQPLDKAEKATDPTQAIEIVQAEMRYLPEKPVKPGDTWTREVDLGIAKATITGSYTAQRAEGATPCAIINSEARMVFTGEQAAKITVETLTTEIAWAIDGSGWATHKAAMTVAEKADKAEQRVVRTFEEKLVETGRLDDTQLAKARADLERIEKAMELARADNLDGALEALASYVKDNPQGPWTPAIQSLHGQISQQRMLTKPVPAPRLRLIMRDLQTARDRAGAQGGPAQVMQVDQTIRQVATVNAQTLLADASDPDPIVRDLAAFGLAFCADEKAQPTLAALLKDASGQVRGTATIGMAILGKPVELAVLTALLKDEDLRTRGAAALLVGRTVKKDDPQAKTVLPMLLENLKMNNPWGRVNTVAAVANIAPQGSVPAATALLEACKAEKEQRLQPAYLGALRAITGVEAKELGPYEEWLKKQPAPAPSPGPTPAAPKG